MTDRTTAMLVELDYCVGCYACQSACQDANDLPVKQTYLRCFVEKPEEVAGEMYCYMSPVPYSLEECARCIEREGGQAPCDAICIGKALHHGCIEEIRALSDASPSRTSVFM